MSVLVVCMIILLVGCVGVKLVVRYPVNDIHTMQKDMNRTRVNLLVGKRRVK